jgi:hypothetical protein
MRLRPNSQTGTTKSSLKDWRDSIPNAPQRRRKLRDGHKVPIKNPASAANGKAKAVVIRHGGESTALRLGRFDLRSSLGKQYRSRVEALVAHLGGADAVSVPLRSLVDQAARLHLLVGIAWTELSKTGAFLKGEPTPALHAFLRLIGEERSVLVTLGLERKAREVPDLQTYLEQKAKEQKRLPFRIRSGEIEDASEISE